MLRRARVLAADRERGLVGCARHDRLRGDVGLEERRLLAFTGNHPENPTLDLPCRDLFARGQKAILVTGPVSEVEAEIAALHERFWKS